MTPTLPTSAVELLNGRTHAVNVADAMSVAYWMHGRDDGTAQFHLDAIHSEFAALADALGYTVARKPAPATVTSVDAAEPARVTA